MTLGDLIDRQTELLEAMGWPGGPVGEDSAKGHLLAAIHECTEAMNELNWKPWKAKKKAVDMDKYATELMDIMQFVANAAIVMGLEEADLERAFYKKLHVCYKRVQTNEVTTNGST